MKINQSLGQTLAYQHNSIKTSRSPDEFYQLIRAASSTSNRNAEPIVQKKLRLQGIEAAIERISALGKRYHENKLLDKADSIRIEHEFRFLKDKILRIADNSLYHDSVLIVDNQSRYKGISESPEQVRDKLTRIINVAFKGKVTANQDLAVVNPSSDGKPSVLTSNAVPTIILNLDVPYELDSLFTKATVTASDLKDEYDVLRQKSGLSEDQMTVGFMKNAVNLTQDFILNRAQSSVTSHLNGIEERGFFLLL